MSIFKNVAGSRAWRAAAWLCGLTLIAIPVALAVMSRDFEAPPNDLIVHEWGTFLAANGSDGVSLEGMYHEEHELPSFVHARSKDQLRLRSALLKGETPVIYFYTRVPQDVRIDVRFPQGVWTQWYPQVAMSAPALSAAHADAEARNGRLLWYANVVPASAETVTLPGTSRDALWNHAREVDAAFVRTRVDAVGSPSEESERFLFYRGLGRAPLPLKFSDEQGGTLILPSSEATAIAHVFVVRIEGGRAAYAYHRALQPGDQIANAIPPMNDAIPLEAFEAKIGDDLANRLVASGLYEKEARAMVNTWRSSYFRTEGIRALFIMPQSWTDAFIPLHIQPAPRETIRVMVGRIELFSGEREARAEAAVRDLGAPDAAARQRAFAFLREQGRYVEPLLRRVVATSQDEGIRSLGRQLLAADFVSDLRAALRSADAADGSALDDDPVYIQSQLAALLHEVGLAAEARAEGERALLELRKRAAPRLDDPSFRGYGRAFARSLEAQGDEREAAAWYGRLVEFSARAITHLECRACHQGDGPAKAEWFRDWWAGRKYASLVERTEGLKQAIARLETSEPDAAATRLRIAYLQDAQLGKQAGDRRWKQIEAMFHAATRDAEN